MTPLEALFDSSGPLAQALDGYRPRTQQLDMAQAVAGAISERSVLVVEAGTGTGKTLAYLLPAIQSEGRVVISTGTKTLQDQLFRKDLPTAFRAGVGEPQAALLKGRANYLCLYRLFAHEYESAAASGDRRHARRIRHWAETTRHGDIAEVKGVPDDSPIWSRVTSTVDNCLGQECPELADCHVFKARRRAMEARIVVINHHLLLADMGLREDGVGELLPDTDVFIIDEAHQLPDIAAGFFGTAVSARQIRELARDACQEHLGAGGAASQRPKAAQRVEKGVQDLRLSFGQGERRAVWSSVEGLSAVESALVDVQGSLSELGSWLQEAAPRSKGLENCLARCERLGAALQQFVSGCASAQVQWFETRGRGFTLNQTPIDIADRFRGRMERYASAWVFTSATLSVGERFDYFTTRIGLQQPKCLRLESPFDFSRHAVLYHPRGLPIPNDPDYTARLVELVVPVLEASKGRAFLLFTSHRALREAAQHLADLLPFPLLIQGELPRAELLERFRAAGNAVLLGTSSFWEGVDVRGRALSCVVIDRLPFASPSDPVLSARIDALRARGDNPFMNYQLPAAVIALKQGVGRLIRDVTDRGVMVICDPRLLTRPYGKVFLDSLPAMSKTRKLEVVQRFFALEAPGD